VTTNCLISVANFGHLNVRAISVSHGISVVAYAGEGTARRSKSFYPSKRTSGSFELELIFAKRDTYKVVCDWLERYCRWASDPNTNASACRVVIPNRDFDKTAVLKGGITFGDDVKVVAHRVMLSFVGSRDPISLSDPIVSIYQPPADTSDPSLPYFYPAGPQLSGSQSGWDLLYDIHEGDQDALEQAILSGRRPPGRGGGD
jgi:hypothetical protein